MFGGPVFNCDCGADNPSLGATVGCVDDKMTSKSVSVDWAEIKRLHALSLNEGIAAFSRRNARELVWEMLYDAFPAIVARLEAADSITHALDFDPDKNYQVADMANCGRSLMEAIATHRPKYLWNNSPAEIVGDLCNEIEELKTKIKSAQKFADRVSLVIQDTNNFNLACAKKDFDKEQTE